MKAHRLWLTAASPVLAVALAACGGSYHAASKSTPKPASQVFTYDTLTTVMPDGWDPAREYSNGIIAMSNIYETLPTTTRSPTRLTRCSRPAGRPRPTGSAGRSSSATGCASTLGG